MNDRIRLIVLPNFQMNKTMFDKNFLWMVPFLFFIAGYLITSRLFYQPTIAVPSVVGKPLDVAFATLSTQQLTIQLLDQKEDATLADTTVVSQIPAPGQYAKPRQTVFLSISKQPNPALAPSFVGKQLAMIEKESRAQKLRLKTYFLTSVYPTNNCIAQIPMPQESIPDATLIVYISKGNTKEIIWPNFKNKSVQEVTDFLRHHSIAPQLITAAAINSDEAMVTDQRPLAGSIISLDEKHVPIVQLFTQ